MLFPWALRALADTASGEPCPISRQIRQRFPGQPPCPGGPGGPGEPLWGQLVCFRLLVVVYWLYLYWLSFSGFSSLVVVCWVLLVLGGGSWPQYLGALPTGHHGAVFSLHQKTMV